MPAIPAEAQGSSWKKPQEWEFFLVQQHALEPELLDAIADLIAVHTEQCGGARLIPSGPLKGLHDERALELLEVDAVRRQFNALGETGRSTGRKRKIAIGQLVAIGQQHRALDGIAELADVARPAV